MKQSYNIINALVSIADSEKYSLTNHIKLSKKIKEVKDEELKQMPLCINVISIAARGKLKETAHSEILQKLLLRQEILTSFQKNVLAIENPILKVEDIRKPDCERMDISIYADNMCLIIENKVNNAEEQCGQIFRYVESAINNGYDPAQIKVLYLNSNHHYPPTDYSLTEKGEGKKRIPEKVELIIKDFRHDVYNWIKGLSEEEELKKILATSSEIYLHSALLQYQDYLEENFYITDKYSKMKERIKTTINTEILKGISDEKDTDFTERLTLLEEAIEDIQELSDGIKEFIDDLSIRQEAYCIQKELNKFGLLLIDMKEYGYLENNYGIRISINGKSGFITYGYGNNIDEKYIGFAFNTSSLSESEKKCLLRLFKRFGRTNAGEEELFPCWCWINTSILNEYVNFVEFVKEQAATEKLFIKF